MSLSSKSRKESTESYASQRRNSVMGVPPELGQLYDRQLENEDMSHKVYSDDVDITDDYEEVKEMVSETDHHLQKEEATIDPDTVYKPETGPGEDVRNDSRADWRRDTPQGSMAPSSADEPDRTIGNS